MRNAGILIGMLLLDACMTEIDPGVLHAVSSIEVTTELATEVTVPLEINVGDTPISDATFSLDGIQLGMLREGNFVVSGLAAGRATLAITYAGDTVWVPIHVRVKNTRVLVDAPATAVSALDSATAAPYDAQLSPASGAVVPPNLGTIDVDFVGEATDDVFEVRAGTEDLELRVVGPTPHLPLSPLEWRVITASVPGGREIGLTSRSLSTASPAAARTANTRIVIGKQPAAAKLLFGGAMGTTPALYHYDVVNASPIAFMSTSPDTTYLGGDVALSQNGWRIAVANANDQGNIVDVPTRTYLVSEDNTQTWTTAAYDPGGYLVTSSGGTLTVREGEDATAITNLTTETNADSPAISPDGSKLAYATTVSATEYEMYVAPWAAATQTLGTANLMFTSDKMITEPTYSSDGAWLLFGGSVASAAGTLTELVADTGARSGWASELGAEGAWIAFAANRSVASKTRGAQLWMAHFDPVTGTISTPFHLPNQPPELAATRAPHYLPQ